MGTLDNQSFKPGNQDGMTSRQDKMPATGPATGRSGQLGSEGMSGNTIGGGGAGDMSAPRMSGMPKAGMGSGRVPTEGNTNSTHTKRRG